MDTFSIFGPLGVPDVWRVEGNELSIYLRTPEATCNRSDAGSCLPEPPLKTVHDALRQVYGGWSDRDVMPAFQSALRRGP